MVPGRVVRDVAHRYEDPLDRIWLVTARRVGLAVERSGEVYASTDGRGALLIGSAATLDADDCLAQIIFHELCHSLIEGEDAFARPDWGLDNTGERDVAREHACLRLQATLAAEHGLRRVLAPTTDFRAFYDALPTDPLAARREPSVALALLGLRRASQPPWAPHLGAALAATAAVAREASRFDTGADRGAAPGAARAGALPSLWREVEPPLARHPAGFAVAADSDPGRRCGTCAWSYTSGQRRVVSRCRQAGARVDPAWPACRRFEDALDCQDCGACCRAAYDSVTVSRRDPVIKRHPALVVHRDTYLELARVPDAQGTRCAALAGGALDPDGAWTPYHCTIYDERPRPCRGFERGSANCLTARRRVGQSW